MFRRPLIVLPSGASSNAVTSLGIAMAEAFGGEVLFYTGLKRELPPAHDLPHRATVARWDALDDTRLEAERIHRQARQRADNRGVLAQSLISISADPVKDILNAGLSNHCDAVVLASGGENAVVRLTIGSVVPGLITASPIPVMVCPAVSKHRAGEGAAMNRLLVVLDDGDTGAVARSVAVNLARAFAAEVTFVHIVPSPIMAASDPAGFAGDLSNGLSAEFQMESHRLLDSAAKFATENGLVARALSLPAGTSAKDIALVATEKACDLILVTHRGSNAVVRLLTGNLIPGLITAAEVPILICRKS